MRISVCLNISFLEAGATLESGPSVTESHTHSPRNCNLQALQFHQALQVLQALQVIKVYGNTTGTEGSTGSTGNKGIREYYRN